MDGLIHVAVEADGEGHLLRSDRLDIGVVGGIELHIDDKRIRLLRRRFEDRLVNDLRQVEVVVIVENRCVEDRAGRRAPVVMGEKVETIADGGGLCRIAAEESHPMCRVRIVPEIEDGVGMERSNFRFKDLRF